MDNKIYALYLMLVLVEMSYCVDNQECHPGSYRASLSECILCEIGTYQNEAGQNTCAHCPQGETTMYSNSTSSQHCIPDCLPGSYISSDQCVRCGVGEYQPQRLQNSCIKCPNHMTTTQRGSKQQRQCVNDTYNGCIDRPCENNGLCVADIDGYYCDCPLTYGGMNCQLSDSMPAVMSVSPLYGPVSGGTSVTIMGEYFSPGNLWGVFLDDVTCTTLSSNSTEIQVLTPALKNQQDIVVGTPWSVSVFFVPSNRIITSFIWIYKPDPILLEVHPLNTILSGGTILTAKGSFFDSIAGHPILSITMAYKHQMLEQPLTYSILYSKFTTVCTVLSPEEMTCPTPNLKVPMEYTTPETLLIYEILNNSTNIPSERSKRKRRQASNGVAGTLINNNLINFTAEIAFDGVVLEVNEPLMVFENPMAAQFVPLVQDYMANSEQSIAIQGEGINIGMDTEYNITVGDLWCMDTMLHVNNTLTCIPPQTITADNKTVPVQVSIGNLEILAGYLRYVYPTTTETTQVDIETTQPNIDTTAHNIESTTVVKFETSNKPIKTSEYNVDSSVIITTEMKRFPSTTDSVTSTTETTSLVPVVAAGAVDIAGITGTVAALFLTVIIFITFCVLVVRTTMRRKAEKEEEISDFAGYDNSQLGGVNPVGVDINRYEQVLNWLGFKRTDSNTNLSAAADPNIMYAQNHGVTPLQMGMSNQVIYNYSPYNTPELNPRPVHSYSASAPGTPTSHRNSFYSTHNMPGMEHNPDYSPPPTHKSSKHHRSHSYHGTPVIQRRESQSASLDTSQINQRIEYSLNGTPKMSHRDMGNLIGTQIMLSRNVTPNSIPIMLPSNITPNGTPIVLTPNVTPHMIHRSVTPDIFYQSPHATPVMQRIVIPSSVLADMNNWSTSNTYASHPTVMDAGFIFM